MTLLKRWSLVGLALIVSLSIIAIGCQSAAPAAPTAAPKAAAPAAAPTAAPAAAPTAAPKAPTAPTAAPAAAPTVAAAPKQLEKVTFRVDFVPQGLYSPFWLAKERGYYKEAGLDVEIMPGSGSLKTVEAVAGKELDFGFANSGVYAVAKSTGRPIRQVAQILGRNSFGFFVPKDSTINKVKDLEGKTLIYAQASPQAALMPGIFKLAGVDGTKVQQVIVDGAAQISTYAAGKGDSVVTSVPYGMPFINPQRASRVLLWADLGFILPDYGLLVHEDTIKAKPDTVRRFVAATLRGWKDSPANQKEALDALFKNWVDLLATKDRTVAEQQLSGFLDYVYTEDTKGKPIGTHSIKEWTSALQTLKEYSGLKGSTDPKDYVSDEFLPK